MAIQREMSREAKNSQRHSEAVSFFQGGGEMGERFRSFDWSETPLGPVESWSPALRMMVRFLLANRFPLLLWWGPQYLSLYNDSYRPVLGAKHPWALGQPVRECWKEIWLILEPLIDTPFHGGPATWNDDILLEIDRYGFVEETHFTIAYSPVPDDTVPSGIGGVLATVHEITEKVIGERRVVALRDLGAGVGKAKTAQEACALAAETLARHDKDVPFILLYLLDPDMKRARLAGHAGIEVGQDISPLTVDLGQAQENGWPIADANLAGTQVVENLSERFATVPPGPWSDRPSTAVVVPVLSSKAHQPAGLLVAGVSARLRWDESYRGFFELVSTQVATAIASARAYEEEKKRAEALAELDREKTAFFSKISHEFRTPLTLMLGPLLETLAQRHGPLPPRVVEELTVVHRNGQRLLKLVNTLLEFSRIEAGRVQASFAPTDLAAFTTDLASAFRSAIEQAGLTLTIEALPLPEPAYVDRDMWEKIVLNLISNAFKFTLTGGITIRVDMLDGWMRLRVEDSGCGIPEEELPRLFERFHRVQSTKGRTHEGTGIGLALVAELVKIHGGTVSVESEVGRGSTFTVIIPAGKNHLPSACIAERSVPTSAAAGFNAFVEEALRWLPDASEKDAEIAAEFSQLDPGNVLLPGVVEGAALSGPQQQGVHIDRVAERRPIIIADDNADMRDYLRRLLADTYDVVAVSDGQKALLTARECVPALILSDVMMPNLDGLGLLEAVRADASLASVPVILLSARAGEEAILEGIRAGADEYLIKPFSARELVARVDGQIQRKYFERQLATAEQRLQSALAAAKMAVLEWKPVTDTVTCSDTVADVFGLLAGQLLDSRSLIFDLVHPEDLEKYVLTVQAAAGSSESFQSDFRIVRPRDGRIAWLEERSLPIRDALSKEMRMVSLIIDVTDRKEAEIALKQSEHRARFILRLDDALRAITDADEMSRTAARILAEHLHCDRALYVEVEPDQDHCSVTGEYTPGLPSVAGSYRISDYGSAYQRSVHANRPYAEHNIKGCGHSPEEEERYTALQIAAFIAAPLFKDGRLVAMFVVHSTVPRGWRADEIESVVLVAARCWESIERARLTRALVASEERLAFSVDAAELGTFYCPMPLGSMFCNAKGNGHYWLPADARIDFDRFYSIIHEEDRQRTRSAIERSVFNHEAYDIVYRTVSFDGQIRWVRAKGRAYFDANGLPTRFDGVTLDVTALKTIEQRREEMLASERAAREEAERVIRMKDEFLATLSHELRTPLNAILGWSQILTHYPQQSEETKQGMEAIERNTRAQAQMIEDLLDMNRISSGKVRLDVRRLVLADVVSQAVQSVRPSAVVKGLRLMTVIDPNAGPVAGDASRLQQVLWNLLTNAIKFTPRGGSVQVVLERVSSQLELSIADSGEGIDPEFLPHVFERFRQADASTTRRFRGLGLGLNIVKHLVELHGGSVCAKSPGKGKGSTFIVTLPLAATTDSLEHQEAEDRQNPQIIQNRPHSFEPPNLQGVKVLVVDDDFDARNLIAKILRDGSASVATASSAAEALEILTKAKPALLICDIGMPDQDGYDFIRKVRALPAEDCGRIPAVAVTAFARSEDRRRALLTGYQLHVAKPVEPSELLAACASLVGRIG